MYCLVMTQWVKCEAVVARGRDEARGGEKGRDEARQETGTQRCPKEVRARGERASRERRGRERRETRGEKET